MTSYIKNIIVLFVVTCFLSCASTNKSEKGYIANQNTTTLLDKIQALPGVTVSGDGSSATIRVRGVNSLAGVNSPLFILDGNDMGYEFSAVDSQISANNIRSVRLLKDPSDVAIYGMRGANGVIVIRSRGTNDAYGK